MDGNGRWAAAHDLPVEEGHREGARALRRTVEAAIDLGIVSLAVYAFSTENWSALPTRSSRSSSCSTRRSSASFRILRSKGCARASRTARPRARRAPAEDGAARDRDEAPRPAPAVIAFDYGGRAELVEAMRRILEEGVRHGVRHQDCPKRTSRPISMRPSSPTRISSSAPPANSGSRTSCSGSRRTPSSSSTTRCGPTSAKSASASR